MNHDDPTATRESREAHFGRTRRRAFWQNEPEKASESILAKRTQDIRDVMPLVGAGLWNKQVRRAPGFSEITIHFRTLDFVSS